MTDELTSIDGVGPAIADELESAGYETPDDVHAASVDELADVHMLGEASAKAILEGDSEAHGGRPSDFTDERARAAIEAAELGKSEEGCGRDASVTGETIRYWRDECDLTFTGPDGQEYEFSGAFRRARGDGETYYITEGRNPEGDVDPSFAKFMLSSSYGYKKTEKREQEISGKDGNPIEVTVNRERYEPDE